MIAAVPFSFWFFSEVRRNPFSRQFQRAPVRSNGSLRLLHELVPAATVVAVLVNTRTDWNAERSEGTQTFPQAARRKIQEDTQLRGECATCGVKQMNGKRVNLKVCQDDPQRTVIYRVSTLVVQNASHTQALGCSPNSRLGGGR